jgi:hypothetical protein
MFKLSLSIASVPDSFGSPQFPAFWGCILQQDHI